MPRSSSPSTLEPGHPSYLGVLGSALLCLIILLAAFAPAAFAQSVVQEYYVALPEAQIRQNFLILAPSTGSTLDSVISLTVGNPGTRVTYDHWEDGYEIDINNPAQTSTRVWGDGNNANGIAPGFANDPNGLPAGAVLALRNLVSLPRNASTILFDGRDRIGASNAVVVSRSAWATSPGSVLADATEMSPTVDWGTSFIAPVGEDVVFPSPLTSSMFEKVSLFVQAVETGTQVQIDSNADGVTDATATLNRGEVHFTASGILKGATVTSNKPVQVHLMTGDVGANYESRWFSIPPASQWDIRYFSPVGTASNGHEAFAFLHNPNSFPVTIEAVSRTGSASFIIPARDTYRHQLPQNSGTVFDSRDDFPFFGVIAVGARPSSNNVYDWGFSLVPEGSLTTALVVGWGPGSSDLSQNGSPVWVTPVANTRLYVDFNGDRNGPLTDPTGQKYDAFHDLAALDVIRIYESDRDQTAMRVYTLDGTLITGAWGQDPAVAGAGNPFLDVGTTVPAFPAPVMTKTSRIFTDNSPPGLSVGDVLEYTVRLDNKSLVSITSVPVLDTLPAGVAYLPNSTTKDSSPVPDAGVTAFPLDEGGLTVPIVRSREFSEVRFLVTINASGTLTNVAEVVGYPGVTALNTINVPGGGGSTACSLLLTNDAGAESHYQAGASVYVTLSDADKNSNPAAAESLQVVVTNASTGDAEFLILSETGPNTGVFRNSSGLPTSATIGLAPDDGTLHVQVGNTLATQYLDPEFGDACSDTASITNPALIKQLYLDTDGSDNDTTGDLDRIDPVATADSSTSSTQSLSSGSSATFTQTPAFVSNFIMPAGGVVTGRAFVQVPSGSLPASPDIPAVLRRNGTPFATLASPTATLLSGGVDTISIGATSSAQSSSTSSLSFNHTVAAGNNRLLLVAVALGAVNSQGNPPSLTGVTFNGTALTLVGSRASGTRGNNDDTESYIYSLVAPPVTTGSVVVTLGGNGSIAAGATSFFNVDQFTPLGAFASAGGDGNNPSVTVTSAPGQIVFGTVAADEGPTLTTGTGQTSLWLRNAYGPTSGAASTEPGAASVTFSYTSNDNSQDWAIAAVPVRPALTSALYQLDWTAPLSSSVTAAAGEALSVVIQNNVPGTPLSFLYDSQARPSFFALPTSTVIDTLSLQVFDAPAPGGDLVTSAAVGQTVYVRAAVTDPFGSYDITSVDLTIDGPGSSSDVSTTLGAPAVVSDNGSVKVYEFPWITSSTEGNYNISVVSKEGFENAISSPEASSFSLTRLDLGTPGSTSFNKDLYAPDESVCVTTTDLDQNLNPAVVESLAVVVTTSSGDSESVVLVETAPNTGSFSACVPASAAIPGAPNNGTLHAPPGTALTVTYIDPDDSTDTSGDSASVPSPVPSMSVSKTLLSPLDGQAVIGESLQFRLRLTNTGASALSSISLADAFPPANLAYLSASTAPDAVSPGALTWSNLGPLAPGQSRDIIVNFTALASASPAVNNVVADAGGGLTASSSANIVITDPGLSVVKSLVSPLHGPAGKGDTVVFSITVQNTGDTPVSSLPLEDSYSGSLFEFVSATPAPDGVGGGSLLWQDLTGSSSLAPGDSIVVSVTLRALGAANPAINNASVLYAIDSHGDPVPPASDSAEVQTLAASISGSVYEDIDADDAFSPGDDPFPSITVRLFNDPNGDGDPADGSLVAVTQTQADGSYEFLNLDTGGYVVVQQDLVGYVSVNDTQGPPGDNRIAVSASSFIDHPGNNFLDAFLDTSAYGVISGQVRDDADADGDLADADSGIPGVTLNLYTDPNGDGNISDGVLLITSVTSGAGSYQFPLVPPGSYVIVETDPAGFVSTSDSSLPNDNRIPVTLAVSGTSAGNHFLDTANLSALSAIGNQVWSDTDNDGQFDIAESGIDGVLVRLFRATQNPGADAPYLVTITSGGGLYEFTGIPAGNYILHIPAANFSAPLANATRSSSVAASSDDTTDNDSNGLQPGGPATPVSSPVFNLAPGETDTTKDFGFLPDLSLATISGFVQADTTGDGLGDTPLDLVQLTLKDSTGAIVAVTTTGASGAYSFTSVPPGSYTIEQDQPPAYVSLYDADGGDPDIIGSPVFLLVTPGSSIAGQDFIETRLASISGTVAADLDGDNLADSPLPDVTITLRDNNGGIFATTTTDGAGIYEFIDLPAGSYTIEQTQPVGFTSLGDFDGGNPNLIGDPTPVTLIPGQNLANQFFTEAIFGSISGTVTRDIDNNNSGDFPVASVTITLLDSSGDTLATTTTDIDGEYRFEDMPAGVYTVVQTDLPGYQSVSPNSVPATVTAGQTTAIHFIDEQLGAISGTVTRDIDNDDSGDQPLGSVTVSLLDSGGNSLATTTIDPGGFYEFPGLAPAEYTVVQTDLAGYQSVSSNSVPATVTAGQTTTVHFIDEQLGAISGCVHQDLNGDENGDSPLSGVGITLQDDLGGILVSTSTDSFGIFRFENVAPGSYIIVQSQPPGFNSAKDEDTTADILASPADTLNSDPLDNRVPVTLSSGETDDGNDFVERVRSSHIYNAITGELVSGGSVSITGPGSVIMVQDGSSGSYTFTLDPANPVPGAYTIAFTPPSGFVIDPTRPVSGPSFDPASGPSPASLGSAASAGFLSDFSAPANPYYLSMVLSPANPFVLQNNLPVVPSKATSWPAWQYLNNLGGLNQPGDNPDGDRYDNLQEFAFCFNPSTGLKTRCPISVTVDPATGRVDVRLLRVTGITGVTYTLEAVTSLQASPAGWSDVLSITPVVTHNPDGTEWAAYQDVGSLAPASTSGFFRARIQLDADLNGTPEAITRTETVGASRRTFASQCETFSMPFLHCDLFSGSVDSVIARVLSIQTSIGSADFAAALVSGTQYYVEVVDGVHAGHRFEVNESLCTANGIAIDAASTLNTLPSLPPSLAGNLVAVRAHQTLDQVFRKSAFTATNSSVTADRVQIHSASGFATYWLCLFDGNPRWVLLGDTGLADMGGLVIAPGSGQFVRAKSGAPVLHAAGLVRSNDFALPLPAGTRMISTGWPVDQSPASLGMSVANGFSGSNNPALSDKIQVWQGDAAQNVSGYSGYFLLRTGPLNQWTPEQNASLTNADNSLLLPSLRAVFFRSRVGLPSYVMPSPWTP